MKTAILCLLLLASACSFDQTIEYQIDPLYQKQVDAFFAEGLARGVVLDHKNLIVQTGDIWKDNRMGLSSKIGHQRVVTMDRMFLNETETHREIIVFHELGHALLGRKHVPGESIMNEFPGFTLYEELDANNKVVVDQVKRTALLNELFHP